MSRSKYNRQSTYYVRNKNNTLILETKDINEAFKTANQSYKAKVLDYFGNTIHTSTLENEEIEVVVPETTIHEVKNSGDAVRLNGAFLYKSSLAASPIKKISGIYYLYDAELVNGRYRLTDKRANCEASPSLIIGYVNKDEI